MNSAIAGASEPFVIYPARRVITINPAFPYGEAVAVAGDRILGVGSTDELASVGLSPSRQLLRRPRADARLH